MSYVRIDIPAPRQMRVSDPTHYLRIFPLSAVFESE